MINNHRLLLHYLILSILKIFSARRGWQSSLGRLRVEARLRDFLLLGDYRLLLLLVQFLFGNILGIDCVVDRDRTCIDTCHGGHAGWHLVFINRLDVDLAGSPSALVIVGIDHAARP